MRDASNNSDVKTFVNILLFFYKTRRSFFDYLVMFLRGNTTPLDPKSLKNWLVYSAPRSNKEGVFEPPPYFAEMSQALAHIYSQGETALKFRRGAIVELFTRRLVCGHCDENECVNNHCFVEGPQSSEQVDVVVLSDARQEIEGYTCKMNPERLKETDCTNLIKVASLADQNGYKAHVGAVCFRKTREIERKMKKLSEEKSEEYSIDNLSELIKAYGLDNLDELEKGPFSSSEKR